MPAWSPYPHDRAEFRFDRSALQARWPRLHAGDAEPWEAASERDEVLAAWSLFHAGEFEAAAAAGTAAGGAGVGVALKAQAAHATFLERDEQRRLALFVQIAERAAAQARAEPRDANAHYLSAYALGRYGQSISVVQALAQGLGLRIKSALDATLALAPRHADAHLALGAFHAEVIDKVGSLLGLTQGASKDAGIAMFKAALALNGDSPVTCIECANGLVMLEGEKRQAEATRLYEQAAASAPADAMERLAVDAARAQLHD